MINFRISLLFVLLLSLFCVSVIPVDGQIRRKRIVREKISRVEVYMDGGYFLAGLSAADQSLYDGASYLVNYYSNLDTLGLINPEMFSGKNEELGSSPTFGGGINFNLSKNYGFGIKFMFSKHSGRSDYSIPFSEIPIYFQELGGNVLVDITDSFHTIFDYYTAPIILYAYYNRKPFPTWDDLIFRGGLGLGLYTTTMEISHHYREVLFSYNPYFTPPDRFYDYEHRYVAQPIGGYFYLGTELKGSSVISIVFNLEYHLVPEYKINSSDWGEPQNPLYYPNILKDYSFMYEGSFEGYLPEKLDISGLRTSISMKFAF